MSKILLTGFNPFGDLEVNPSALVVEKIAGRTPDSGIDRVIMEVLPTEFTAAGTKIRELIQNHKPEAILMVGVSEGLTAISLERVALNLDDSDYPDNAGESRSGQLILPDAPRAYWSTLPLERIKSALESRRIPAFISNHAGAYVCNHAFYLARHEVEESGNAIPCGFIHIPLISKGLPAAENEPTGLPLSVMVEAVECCLEVIQEG